MARRILIGKKNDKAGVWVSPPGVDVTAAGKMVLDSDFQCLMLHHYDVKNVSGIYDPYTTFAYSYYGLIPDVTFPELPHLPLAWVFYSDPSGAVLPFPPNTGYTTVGNSGAALAYRVHRDRVVFPGIYSTAIPFSTLPTIRVWTMVFKNPVEI